MNKQSQFVKLFIFLPLLFLSISSVLFCGKNQFPKKNETKKLQNKSTHWFKAGQVAKNVWRIDDNGSDNMYLVEGTEKALLIDTGTGIGDLRLFVSSLTRLPIIVINTHGHPDHCGSDYQFGEVYAHPADFEMIRNFCSDEYHNDAVTKAKSQNPDFLPEIVKNEPELKLPRLIPIKEGHIFNLGGRKLEVIESPGHTRGSICLLDCKNKLLFTGDNDNTLVWMFLKDSLPLEEYLNTLVLLQKRTGEYSTLLPGHGNTLDISFIDEQIECVKRIINGDCTSEPYKTFVDYARVSYYKRAEIAFDPNNIHSK